MATVALLIAILFQATPPSHDLSGLWQFFNGIPGQGIYATPSRTPPPLTPWAQERFDAARPGYGPKAVPGGNDPILHCDPTGIPRVLYFPQPFEIIQTADRVVMFFERDHLYRPIWLNRRDHPDEATELWVGDSVGWWEGDTFVVDTVGFNDKSWLDFYGYPHSDEMHLIERYKRVDANTMTLNFTVEDPKAFTKPWVSDTKIYRLLPKGQTLTEIFCVPEEEEAFTQRIRMPAAAPKTENPK
jgi:hypothetical protein